MRPVSRDEEAGLIPRVLFVLCGIGLNLAPSIYFAYVNVYASIFQLTVLGWMSLSLMGSGLIVICLQFMLDWYFDNKYGSKTTYSFRIGIGLLGLGLVLIAIPFATREAHVLWLGVFIGIFGGATMASLNQMASVVHTTFTKYVATGMTIGQGIPIPLSLMLGFGSTNASNHVRVLFAWLPAFVCLLTFIVFSVMTCFRGNFDAAFATMDETFMAARGNSPALPLATSARSTDIQEEVGSRSHDFWFKWPISGCAIMQLLGNFLAGFIMPFFTYFGSLALAHDLILVRFGGELLGRVGSHYIRLWACGLLTGKGLVGLLIITGIRGVMVLVFMVDIANPLELLGRHILFGMMAVFYILYAWSQSEVMVLVVQVGPKTKKVELMRGMTLLMFIGQISSAALAIAVQGWIKL